MKDDLEYHLEDPEDTVEYNNKFCTKKKIIISFIILLTLIIIAIVILIVFRNKIFKKEEEKEEELKQYINITYVDDNNLIENSFKEGGDNYNKDFGNINNGKDYNKSEFNTYNLYIPKQSMKRKNKLNGILLFLHPGAWIGHNKEKLITFSQGFSKLGYITCTTGYTLLNTTNQFSIFRILDEITATIKSIKMKLKKEGFDETKLKMAIGGLSAGGHLALLYGYAIKSNIIPIKFIINFAGPVTLDPEKYLKNKIFNQTLENIEEDTINKAIEEGNLYQIKEGLIKPSFLIKIMNFFIGKKYSDNEINELIIGVDIKKEDQKYKEIYNLAEKAGSPLYYINKDSIPTLCFYGGNDEDIGVVHYSLLKKKFKEKGNDNIVLIYSRYADHPNILEINTSSGKEKLNEFIYQFNNFSKKYFNLD